MATQASIGKVEEKIATLHYQIKGVPFMDEKGEFPNPDWVELDAEIKALIAESVRLHLDK